MVCHIYEHIWFKNITQLNLSAISTYANSHDLLNVNSHYINFHFSQVRHYRAKFSSSFGIHKISYIIEPQSELILLRCLHFY